MRILFRSLFTLLAAFVALATADGRARAQYTRLGFIGAGPGGAPDEAYLNRQFTLAGGFIARFGPPVGVQLGLRTITVYSRFNPDERALLDSLGVASGTIEGGSATVTETGVDGVVSYDTGVLGGYGWYGIHYYNERRSDTEITTPSGTHQLGTRGRADLGPSYGAGLNVHISPRASLFGEWSIGGGFDDRMIRMEGFRAGIMGVF
jgi:hypothetical protein